MSMRFGRLSNVLVIMYLYSIRQNSIEFLRPVFLYILCNPSIIADAKSLWTCLLSQSDNNTKAHALIHEVLCWVNVLH